MPQIGPMEILVVGVLALLVFGPDKLPEMARTAGKTLHQFKRMAADAKSQFDDATTEDEEPKSDLDPVASGTTTTGADISPDSTPTTPEAVDTVVHAEATTTAGQHSVPAGRP
ncbi:MAG: twin-arginine translocase TatA/TatE family subunit [Actinomycetota bacterium]|nr:twin-arginine translocase TatA/TatE family subunit [Actinomycetota bacterium]